jgi:biopolymer transport protein ExbD
MIPLIDIVFLLLVVFIYAMLSMTVHKGIRIELPESTTAEVDQEEHFSVSIAADGTVYVDLDAVDLKELTGLVEAEVNRKGALHVLVNAHKDISHGRLVQVLDSIRYGGVTSLSIMTEDYNDEF